MPAVPAGGGARRGLERGGTDRVVADAEVLHPRAVRRHIAGADDFAHRLKGHRVGVPSRRGKYLWLPLEDTHQSVLAHLGMSGQLLIRPESAPDEKHLRIRVRFADTLTSAATAAGATELRFVDQRTFGGLSLHDNTPEGLPDVIAHIARDPLDPLFDDEAFHQALRRKRTTIKRALLDQPWRRGAANTYADAALWRARAHYERPTAGGTRPRTAEPLGHVRDVMNAALAVGGTSFDSLYVNVNGESGYFDRSLDAYGREGLPCKRCGTPMRRRPWMNRSSYFCPKCQRAPRAAS